MKEYYYDTIDIERKITIEFAKTIDVKSNYPNGISYDYPFIAYTDSKKLIKKLAEIFFVSEIEFNTTEFDQSAEAFYHDTLTEYRYKITGYNHSKKLLDYSQIKKQFSSEFEPIVKRQFKIEN